MLRDPVVLIASAGEDAADSGSLVRLVSSIPTGVGGTVTLIVGNRTKSTLSGILSRATCDAHEVGLPANASLSRSRNVLLTWAEGKGLLDPRTIVNFPDDDSWFLPGADAIGEAARGLRAGADVVVGRFAPSLLACDRDRFSDHATRLRPAQACLVANSVSMFWRADALRAVGAFDERLGAGTSLHSSEDLDMLLRALISGLTVHYEPSVLIGHEYGVHKRSPYFVGNIAALRKNAPALPLLWPLLARRLGGGARRLLKKEVDLRDYRQALRLAWQGIEA